MATLAEVKTMATILYNNPEQVLNIRDFNSRAAVGTIKGLSMHPTQESMDATARKYGWDIDSMLVNLRNLFPSHIPRE